MYIIIPTVHVCVIQNEHLIQNTVWSHLWPRFLSLAEARWNKTRSSRCFLLVFCILEHSMYGFFLDKKNSNKKLFFVCVSTEKCVNRLEENPALSFLAIILFVQPVTFLRHPSSFSVFLYMQTPMISSQFHSFAFQQFFSLLFSVVPFIFLFIDI